MFVHMGNKPVLDFEGGDYSEGFPEKDIHEVGGLPARCPGCLICFLGLGAKVGPGNFMLRTRTLT